MVPCLSSRLFGKETTKRGVDVEHRTPNREVLGSISTGGTVLCP